MSTRANAAAVRRAEILVGDAYEAQRETLRASAMKTKARRRIHLGDHLTFLFENRETIRYQVQEMLRIEKRSADNAIEHELATYNELLGDPGDLGCTLLIEIDDASERDRLLVEWLALPRHVFVQLEDDRRIPAEYDERQVGEGRLSSVQYLRFGCAGAPPAALVCDLPGLELRTDLTPVQRKALAEDLAASLGN